MSNRHLPRRPIILPGWTAAILYSSWPLGYILNPAVGRHELASQLEAQHQPYAWVFIAMDVLTGVALLVSGFFQLKRAKRTAVRWTVVGYMAFGLLTAAAALAPLNCNPEAHNCAPPAHTPLLLIHDTASTLAPSFLALGLLSFGMLLYRQRFPRQIVRAFTITIGAWLISGAAAAIEWLFYIHGNVLQYYFIVVCSLSIAVLIGAIEQLSPALQTVAARVRNL